MFRYVFFTGLFPVLFMVFWTEVSGAEIPVSAAKYRAELIRTARLEWGLNAPTAVFAAQIHAESLWKTEVKSPVGALGLAQFMPTTANWLSQITPKIGTAAPFNPSWSIRALCAYDFWLWQRVKADSPCDQMAMVLSAYNGGLGWLRKDIRKAEKQGIDPKRWWNQVETVNAGRASWAIKENREYPRKILLRFAPIYEKNGWGTRCCR